MGSSFELKLRNQLSSQGVTTADVEFIMSLIRCGDLDENLKIMENDAYIRLEERNLKDQFEKACNVLGFIFTHNNEEEQ
jgi:hypothetical protein